MTDDRMALAELLEKGSDSNLLREMVGYVAQRLHESVTVDWAKRETVCAKFHGW